MSFSFHFILIFDFREGKGRRKRGRETLMQERNINWLPSVHTPTRRSPVTWQPRHVPQPGIQLVTLQFVGWCPPNRATPAGLPGWALHIKDGRSILGNWLNSKLNCLCVCKREGLQTGSLSNTCPNPLPSYLPVSRILIVVVLGGFFYVLFLSRHVYSFLRAHTPYPQSESSLKGVGGPHLAGPTSEWCKEKLLWSCSICGKSPVNCRNLL